jgi:hypothetical protein
LLLLKIRATILHVPYLEDFQKAQRESACEFRAFIPITIQNTGTPDYVPISVDPHTSTPFSEIVHILYVWLEHFRTSKTTRHLRHVRSELFLNLCYQNNEKKRAWLVPEVLCTSFVTFEN